MQNPETQARELRGGMNGQLRIGFVGNIVSDPTSPFRLALERFRWHPRNSARLLLEVLSPPDCSGACSTTVSMPQ